MAGFLVYAFWLYACNGIYFRTIKFFCTLIGSIFDYSKQFYVTFVIFFQYEALFYLSFLFGLYGKKLCPGTIYTLL
jgi:hypothetical protein